MHELQKDFVLRNQYRVLSTIGRGATSRVYLAKNLRNGQLCAVKAITTDPLGDKSSPANPDMVMTEARVLTGLSHDGLPQIYDFFAGGEAFFLVMEWIAGQTLFQIVNEQGAPASESEVFHWGLEMCEILGYLHAHRPNRIVVGDIKPNNIMRTYEGKIKLIDFGVARYSDSPKRYTFVTPGYSPPEQYDKISIDHRSDIYSLGATLYYLLTMAPMERYRVPVPPLRDVMPSCSHEMERILRQCLEVDRQKRYQNVVDLRKDLLRAQEVEERQDNVKHTSAREILAELYKSKKKPSR